MLSADPESTSPAMCHSTTLIISDAHQRTVHGGVQLTLATLRRQYWIVKGRAEVKRVIRACITCTRHAAQWGKMDKIL